MVSYCAAPTGMGQLNDPCTSPTECYSGTQGGFCYGLDMGTTGICKAYCDVAAGNAGCVQVPVSQSCQQIAGAPTGYGVCLH
jgi:hypothetical protein